MSAISYEPSQEQRDNTAKRIGRLFGLTDPGMQITREGVRMESWGKGDEVLLKVELVTWISREEAEAIIGGIPLPDVTS